MPVSPEPQLIATQIHRRTTLRPSLAIVLGSGFQHGLDHFTAVLEIPFAEIPGFPVLRVPGHRGRFLVGYLNKVPTVLLDGRAHHYEGHSLATLTFPIRVLKALGVQDLVLTNAAGGINRKFRPGDFMFLADHINLMGANPLQGFDFSGASRFVDLTQAYDRTLNNFLKKAARQCGARMHAGVYLAVSGPSYETPAEIRAFGLWGADAVGMSTVPECIVARQCGLKVAAVSCITNLAAGRSPVPLSHEEVLATGKKVKNLAAGLLENFAQLHQSGQST